MSAVMGGMTAEEIMRLAQGGAQAPASKKDEKAPTARAQLEALGAPVDLGSRGASPTAATAGAPAASARGRANIDVPSIQVEEQNIVPRLDPAKYEWTGTDADLEVVEKLRNRYKWEAPERGTPGYSGMFGGTPGTAHGLGYRNDNPIDYSTQGAGLWSMGIDPNDPAVGYHLAAFKNREPENWEWANAEYWKNNKRTGNQFADDMTVLDWYWRDLARRMDKSNSFFDSFIGKLFTNIAVGWATAGVGNLLGPWAASLFGGIVSGVRSDWDPLSTILGAAGPHIGNIMQNTGVTNLAQSVLPDWAEFVLPKPGYDFDYGLDDIAESAGWTVAGEAFNKIKNSMQPAQPQDQTAYGNPFAPGATPATTPSSFRPTNLPVLPYESLDITGNEPEDMEEDEMEGDRLPTPFAMGGPVSDMSNDDFINSAGGNAMYGDARKELEALMAQQQMPTQPMMGYADGGMVDDPYDAVTGYAAGGMADSGLPSYLGDPVEGMPEGFYYINPNRFNFYRMASQQDSPGFYTIGRPRLTTYDRQGGGYAVRSPGAGVLARIAANQPDAGWNRILGGESNRAPFQPYHQMVTAPVEGALPRLDITKPAEGISKRDYNRAMRQLARAARSSQNPFIAYYNPEYSTPRGRNPAV